MKARFELEDQLEELRKTYKKMLSEDPHGADLLKISNEMRSVMEELEGWQSQREPSRPDPKWQAGTDGFETGSFRVSNRRQYRDLFPEEKLSNDGFKSFQEFFYTVMSGQPNMNLRAMSESVGSMGGYLVPSEFSKELFDVSLEDEIVRPRCTIYPMASDERKIPATVIGNHSSNLYGGVACLWKAEAGALSAAEPRFREMTLSAKKLTAFGVASNELAADGINFEQSIGTIFPKAIGWTLDEAFLNSGTGAGMPLSILNSGCTLSVTRGTSSTILYADVAGMVGKLFPPCFKNAVWVAHVTTIVPLLQLETVTGIPLLQQGANGKFSMLSKEVIFTEKVPALGSKGDLGLYDFSQYVVGLRKEVRLDKSEHLYFDSDRVAYRAILRADGQVLWNEALTLADGSSQVSPFVVLN
jgi:HK97 family phage major capsid protein